MKPSDFNLGDKVMVTHAGTSALITGMVFIIKLPVTLAKIPFLIIRKGVRLIRIVKK